MRALQRADFLAASRGKQIEKQGFILQTARRDGNDAEPLPPRFGFTISKRVGNAVKRNRIRRRLREAARLASTGHAKDGADYVLIARRASLDLPFTRLVADLADGLDKVETSQPASRRSPRRRPDGKPDAARQ